MFFLFLFNICSEFTYRIKFFKQKDVETYFPLYLSLINTPMFVFEMFPFIFLISTQFFLILSLQTMR